MIPSCTIQEKPPENKPAEARLSDQEWREIWLQKLSSQMQNESIPEEQTEKYYSTVHTSLEKHPKAPNYIPYHDFLNSGKIQRAEYPCK